MMLSNLSIAISRSTSTSFRLGLNLNSSRWIKTINCNSISGCSNTNSAKYWSLSASAGIAAAAAGAIVFALYTRPQKIVVETTGLELPRMPWTKSIPINYQDLASMADNMPVEQSILVTAPNVPPVIKRMHPVLLKVDLTTDSSMIQLTSKYKYEGWNFNDSIPGPFIRARVGDVIELSITNRDKTGNPHNIDCHGFEGPGGGAGITLAGENETKRARFKALYPGLYIYHCAAAPVPVHIANGMYGLMYIQSEYNTLPPVDKEYYVMQSEFYHEPPEKLSNGRNSDIVEFSYPRGLQEDADVVVFNGKESALTRDSPLKAETGDSVRIFFGNGGPNLTSSFHVIGSIFENVYRDGDVISSPGKFIQTVSVPPGGSTIVDMKMLVPGTYTLVDHAIFRLDKGCVGFLNVTGEQRPDIYYSENPSQSCIGCKLHS